MGSAQKYSVLLTGRVGAATRKGGGGGVNSQTEKGCCRSDGGRQEESAGKEQPWSRAGLCFGQEKPRGSRCALPFLWVRGSV